MQFIFATVPNQVANNQMLLSLIHISEPTRLLSISYRIVYKARA